MARVKTRKLTSTGLFRVSLVPSEGPASKHTWEPPGWCLKSPADSTRASWMLLVYHPDGSVR